MFQNLKPLTSFLSPFSGERRNTAARNGCLIEMSKIASEPSFYSLSSPNEEGTG